MSSNAIAGATEQVCPQWRFGCPPETGVWVDEDVLALRMPLVRVRRDPYGGWTFEGPAGTQRQRMTPPAWREVPLEAVVNAWPHVAALSELDSSAVVVWSWRRHRWASESECGCGRCGRPVPVDLDRRSWPSDLRASRLVNVETTALSGLVTLTDIISTPDGAAFLGPGRHQRTPAMLTPVAAANAIRRWPHAMHALRLLREGRGMRWDPHALQWQEVVLD